jgi:hypothetical protein
MLRKHRPLRVIDPAVQKWDAGADDYAHRPEHFTEKTFSIGRFRLPFPFGMLIAGFFS